jgi:hypothetical protein
MAAMSLQDHEAAQPRPRQLTRSAKGWLRADRRPASLASALSRDPGPCGMLAAGHAPPCGPEGVPPSMLPDEVNYHGPICRAAPTRLAFPGAARGRKRRWAAVIAGIAATALLAGASVALAATASGSSGPSAPVPAARSTAAPGGG